MRHDSFSSLIIPKKYFLICFCFIVSLVFSACSSQPADKGVMAEVNGENIFFSEVDALRNILFTGLAEDGTPPDDEALKEQYSYALTQLIQQELVRQYLVRKKINIDESLVVKEELAIQTDHHASENFKNALLESGISPTIWHDMMLRRQHLLTFVSEVLRPQVRISSEEVENYYNKHKDSFTVPEQWHFMQISGKDKDEVLAARDSFIESQNASSISLYRDILLRDVSMGRERLPEETSKILEKQKILEKGDVIKHSEGYVSYVLLEKIPSSTMGAAETYKRVEQILLEDKVQEKLSAWINKEYGKAKIRISTYLLDDTRTNGSLKDNFKDITVIKKSQEIKIPDTNSEITEDIEPD